MRTDGEKFDGWIMISAALHGLVFLLVAFSPTLFPMDSNANWGTNTAGDGGINVKIGGAVSGVSLPSPEVVTEGAAANDSQGFYKTEDAVPPEPENAEPIPETKAPVKITPKAPKPRQPVTPAKTPPAEQEAPPNAVPFGQGGRPALTYGQFTTGAGPAGIGF